MELRDAGVHINIIAIRQHAGDETKLMKSWVSEPKKTHFMHVPGLLALQADSKSYVTQTLVQSCPRASSKTRRKALRKIRGWKMVRENQDCPEWWIDLGKFSEPDQCGAKARVEGYEFFTYGKSGSEWAG